MIVTRQFVGFPRHTIAITKINITRHFCRFFWLHDCKLNICSIFDFPKFLDTLLFLNYKKKIATFKCELCCDHSLFWPFLSLYHSFHSKFTSFYFYYSTHFSEQLKPSQLSIHTQLRFQFTFFFHFDPRARLFSRPSHSAADNQMNYHQC